MTDRSSSIAALAGTACLLFASAGCLNANLTNPLGCSSNGRCPSPYQCSAETNMCVLPSSDDGSGAVTNLGTFDTGLEGFSVDTYDNPQEVNLGASTTNPPQLVWDPVEGDPAPGALKVTVPFTDYGQEFDVIKNITSGLQDWTGKTLHVLMKVASGGNPAGVPMGVLTETDADVRAIDGGAVTYPFAGRWTNEVGNDWQEFTFSTATASFIADDWDVTKIGSFGIQLQTGTPDPLPATKPTTAVVYIDSFTLTSGD
jgi:hypothetical protein